MNASKEFMDLFNEAKRKQEEATRQWVQDLRERSVMAAHPNDGWINPKELYLTFAHPHFNDGAKKGDLVALGWGKSDEIIVRLIFKRKGFVNDSWDYEVV